MKLHTPRLEPGSDLKVRIEDFVKGNKIEAGLILACMADLTQASLRMPGASPDQQDVRLFPGPLLVASLVGTVSVNGCHIHMAVSDNEGRVFGGHLKEGSLVDLTAEIVIGEVEDMIFTRELDSATGFPELVVRQTHEAS